MKSVGAYQAKTHLPKLLAEVQNGETVTITRHGMPIALLQPVDPGSDRRKVVAAIQALTRFRKGRTLRLELRAVIEEGRR